MKKCFISTFSNGSGTISRCMILRMVSASVPIKRSVPKKAITAIIALSSGSSVTRSMVYGYLRTCISKLLNLLSSSSVWQLRGVIIYGEGMVVWSVSLVVWRKSRKKFVHPRSTSSTEQTLGTHLPRYRNPPPARLCNV